MLQRLGRVADMGERRTTVVLEEHLYREVKRFAAEQDTSLKDIVEQALRTFLQASRRRAGRSAGPRFGVYPGKAVTDLRRETLYPALLK
jgi:metal-responsive CopG/Arc/MetJ family transcriptional regulator